jgi:HK97 family phage major capsid protein
MAKTLASLRAERGALIDEMTALTSNDNFSRKAFDALEAKVAAVDEKIAATERAQELARGDAKPVDGGPASGHNGKGFKNLGEQLIAIARHYSGGASDPRLVRAPFGAGETDPSAGGFLVQTDFAAGVLQRVYDLGEVSKRVFRLSISSNANGIKIPGIDETSRATGSRWGGVQAYWLAEGDPATATKPKFRLIELDLKKLMAVWYVTDELMADAEALTGIANEAFAQEIQFMLEDSVFHGTGGGMPLGILNAPGTYQVAAEKSQASKTLLWENVLNMWTQMWARSRLSSCWFINQELEAQLYQLRQVVGTGGQPVYLPPGGASGSPYSTLLGRPVVPVEYCEAPGTVGDIVLADLSQYVMADKNSMQQMSSIHVRFLTDEMTFRITYRCDGQPIWHTPLTPFKGTGKRSPFITLASR